MGSKAGISAKRQVSDGDACATHCCSGGCGHGQQKNGNCILQKELQTRWCAALLILYTCCKQQPVFCRVQQTNVSSYKNFPRISSTSEFLLQCVVLTNEFPRLDLLCAHNPSKIWTTWCFQMVGSHVQGRGPAVPMLIRDTIWHVNRKSIKLTVANLFPPLDIVKPASVYRISPSLFGFASSFLLPCFGDFCRTIQNPEAWLANWKQQIC